MLLVSATLTSLHSASHLRAAAGAHTVNRWVLKIQKHDWFLTSSLGLLEISRCWTESIIRWPAVHDLVRQGGLRSHTVKTSCFTAAGYKCVGK